MAEKKGWKQIPVGNIIPKPATSLEYKTGGWKAFRPIWIKENCINCKFCWLFCPDNAIILDKDRNMIGVDLDYCKGCGICADVCPATPSKALHMMTENDARDEKKVKKLIGEKRKKR